MGDVGTAFLHAELPEHLNVCIRPPRTEDPPVDQPGEMLKILRAMYGLREAPKAFQEFFAKEVAKLGWRRLRSDPQLWIHSRLDAMMMVHVEDSIFRCI